jgi:hypothetical protein
MDSLPVIVLSLLIGAGGYFVYRAERQRIPKKAARFAEREPIHLNEVYERFYVPSGLNRQRVLELWQEVAKTLRLDPEKLRPTDSFDVELAPVKGSLTPDELGDLTDFYKSEWRKLGQAGTPPKVETLDEFIRTLCVPSQPVSKQ